MALKIDYVTQFGFTVVGGYFKISELIIDTEKNKVRFVGDLYFDKDARVNEVRPIVPQIFTYDFEGIDLNANIREQIYAKCKEEGLKVKNETEDFVPEFYIFKNATDA